MASIASVFGRTDYKPLAPLSALLAIALLVGGLAILVLDLGRPDRLLVAVTHQNPRSIFAWNILLYTGFLVVVGGYLATMLNRRLGRHGFGAGFTAFLWRLVLTTGTGCIFGFLAARALFHSAIMAPLFIAMSLAFGLAVFILLLPVAAWLGGARPGPALLQRLGRLLANLRCRQLLSCRGAARRQPLRAGRPGAGAVPAARWRGLSGAAVGRPGSGRDRPAAAARLHRPSDRRRRRRGAGRAGAALSPDHWRPGVPSGPATRPAPAVQLRRRRGRRVCALGTELLLGLGGLAIALLLAMLGCRLFRILPTDLPEPAA